MWWVDSCHFCFFDDVRGMGVPFALMLRGWVGLGKGYMGEFTWRASITSARCAAASTSTWGWGW